MRGRVLIVNVDAELQWRCSSLCLGAIQAQLERIRTRAERVSVPAESKCACWGDMKRTRSADGRWHSIGQDRRITDHATIIREGTVGNE